MKPLKKETKLRRRNKQQYRFCGVDVIPKQKIYGWNTKMQIRASYIKKICVEMIVIEYHLRKAGYDLLTDPTYSC